MLVVNKRFQVVYWTFWIYWWDVEWYFRPVFYPADLKIIIWNNLMYISNFLNYYFPVHCVIW